MGKKILLIGGAGFIGINAAQRFLEEGHEVTILDNLSRRGTDLNLSWLRAAYPDRWRFVRGDIRFDRELLEQEVAGHEAIYQLAAQVAVTTSVANPREDFEINALGTFNVLEAARLAGHKPLIVYSSTNKVYGDLETLAIREDEKRYALSDYPAGISESYPLDFHSPYGCSKGAADQYMHDYARIYGLPTVVLRQSCIYGQHQFGIEDQGWVAWFIIAFLSHRPVTLYGNGKQVRDILFVDDLTRLYSLLFVNREQAAGKIYNVGGGSENTISLLEFLGHLRDEYGFDITCRAADPRPGDQKVFVSDNSALERDLGWKPAVGSLAGIEKITAWIRENLPLIQSLYT